MVSHIRKMAVEKYHWLEDQVFKDGVALCQAIPGATAMQTAAFVGFKVKGPLGAAASFVGFGLPAFTVMIALTFIYKITSSIPVVIIALKGLQAIVVAIVAQATVSFGKTSLKSLRHCIIGSSAAALFIAGIHPLVVIVIAGLGGLVLPTDEQPRIQYPRPNTTLFDSLRLTLGICLATGAGLGGLYFVDRELFTLSAIMLRVDLFAFGGGFASIPLLFNEIVDKRHWLNGPTFMDGILLGQITPGPIVITATFIGYWLHGLVGGFVATVSIFLPSFTLVLGLAPVFDQMKSSKWFNQITGGILCSFVGLLLTVTAHFAGNVQWNWFLVGLAISAFIALILKVDLLWVVLAGIGLSFLVQIS